MRSARDAGNDEMRDRHQHRCRIILLLWKLHSKSFSFYLSSCVRRQRPHALSETETATQEDEEKLNRSVFSHNFFSFDKQRSAPTYGTRSGTKI